MSTTKIGPKIPGGPEAPKTEQDAGKAAKDAAEKMKAAGRAHLVVLIDESGSMSGLREAVVTGANEFLQQFKGRKKTRAWIAAFDSHPGTETLRWLKRDEKTKDAKALMPGDYAPRGMTPLNDAILLTVADIDATVDADDAVFMTIITDGGENSSEVKDPTKVQEALKRFEERGWAFVFIGANGSAQASARAFGVAEPGNSFDFQATDVGVSSTFALAGASAMGYVGEYGSTGSSVTALRTNSAKRGGLAAMKSDAGTMTSEDLANLAKVEDDDADGDAS